MPDPDPTRPPPGQPYATTPVQPNPYAPAGYPAQPMAYPPQPVPVYPAAAPPARPVADREAADEAREAAEERAHPHLIVVSHSSLFYWWPVWVMGFVMAGLTWWYGQSLAVGPNEVRLHPSNNLGVLFFLTVFLVVLISNVEVRGLASVVVILGLVLTAVLMAYFGVWDNVLGWVGDLNVYLNQGAYFWFSILLFVTWVLATFVFDRMNYWEVKPGQVTRQRFWGAGSESYDTENLTLEKRRDDLFRHWILGLGSGDLRIHTYGARQKEIFIPNVLFVGFKVHTIQHLIAQQPGTMGHPRPADDLV